MRADQLECILTKLLFTPFTVTDERNGRFCRTKFVDRKNEDSYNGKYKNHLTDG